MGDLKTTFEFELFGTGVDAGQTTFRLRHAYGELGHFGAGQTWSPFMDPDVFPNSLEYWGPTGMVFFRNVQVRWMPIKGDHSVTLALERPGASGDAGRLRRPHRAAEHQGRASRCPTSPAPTSTAQTWGYVARRRHAAAIKWDDVLDDQFDLSGERHGLGAQPQLQLKFGKNDVSGSQFVFGEGIQNYMNDSPVDIGIVHNPGNP